jgi:adenylate cyclase
MLGIAMATEIERKFLLPEAPAGLEEQEGQTIEQGYLAVSEEAEVRIRRLGGESLLTVKLGRGEVREEVETRLSGDQDEKLWPLTEGKRVTKTRFRVPLEDGDLCAEVDVYSRDLEGLVTAEVEFPGREEDEAFEPPGWLGREITGDQRFANRSLALHGNPDAE